MNKKTEFQEGYEAFKAGKPRSTDKGLTSSRNNFFRGWDRARLEAESLKGKDVTWAKTLKCEECGHKIIIEGASQEKVDAFAKTFNLCLCTKCDPGFASLLDNKYHNRPEALKEALAKQGY